MLLSFCDKIGHILLCICSDDVRARIHMASLRQTPRIATSYPIFEPPTTTIAGTTAATITGNTSIGVFSSHKHKRGSSSSRRATTSGAVAATVREQNLAELDPSGFARLLNERLQRVVEDRAAMERLERLMSEVCLL